jgi:hypothetical protein
MRRAIPFAVVACILSLTGAARAQTVDVLTEILTGGPTGPGTQTTNLGTLQVGSINNGIFQQQPELQNPSAGINTPQSERLFKHDYTFVIPAAVEGQATANDLPNTLEFIAGTPILDIAQFTIALFTDGGPGNGGTLVDPPGVAQVLNPGNFVQLVFSNLLAGEYTLRVAGILNGFDSDGEWHGEYQGSVAITPLPGALVMFMTALAGLGFAGWRRSTSAGAAA